MDVARLEQHNPHFGHSGVEGWVPGFFFGLGLTAFGWVGSCFVISISWVGVEVEVEVYQKFDA